MLTDYDALLAPEPDGDSAGGWMVSYMDVMTLLVALFVLLLSLSTLRGDGGEQSEGAALVAVEQVVPVRLGVPLPEGAMVNSRPAPAASPLQAARPMMDALSPQVVVVALGVARRPLAVAHTVNNEPPPASMAPILDDKALEAATRMAETVFRQRAALVQLPNLDGVEVSHVAEGISLRVEEKFLFPSAEAQLTGSGEDVIGSLVELIQRYEGDVSVEGHSDSRPISTPQFPSNWELSSARATAILRYLAQSGVAENRLRAVGFGSTRPLESNDTLEGRARNRRVEVIIHM